MGTTAGFWVSFFVTALLAFVLFWLIIWCFPPPSTPVFSLPLPCMQVTLPLTVAEFCCLLLFFLMSWWGGRWPDEVTTSTTDWE